MATSDVELSKHIAIARAVRDDMSASDFTALASSPAAFCASARPSRRFPTVSMMMSSTFGSATSSRAF